MHLAGPFSPGIPQAQPESKPFVCPLVSSISHFQHLPGRHVDFLGGVGTARGGLRAARKHGRFLFAAADQGRARAPQQLWHLIWAMRKWLEPSIWSTIWWGCKWRYVICLILGDNGNMLYVGPRISYGDFWREHVMLHIVTNLIWDSDVWKPGIDPLSDKAKWECTVQGGFEQQRLRYETDHGDIIGIEGM